MAGKKSKAKPKSKPKPKAKSKAASTPKVSAGSGVKIECAECNGKFDSSFGKDLSKEVGRKFSCPNCGALFDIISFEQSRITVTVLAKGETRTYGKTYDLASTDYARPL